MIPLSIRLDDAWQSCCAKTAAVLPPVDADWKTVSVPHNWEAYEGYRVLKHGSVHGTAWYRREIATPEISFAGQRLFVEFEGVGSYATVFLNGQKMGCHAGGRTCFSVDLTAALQPPAGATNELLVRVDHPEGIDDLPFVCGGCWGAPNTEGSQPFGIFRPVHLYATGPVRTLPFGVFARAAEWRGDEALLALRTELRNFGDVPETVQVEHRLIDPAGQEVLTLHFEAELQPGQLLTREPPGQWFRPLRWSLEEPHLYRVETKVHSCGTRYEATEFTTGFRQVQWPVIVEPEKDHNVRSIRQDQRLVDPGDTPPTAENNGHTTRRVTSVGPARIAPMGVGVYREAKTGGSIRLRFEIKIEAAPATGPLTLSGELQNEGGTVFFQQFTRELPPSVGEERSCVWVTDPIHEPVLWSESSPYLHKLVLDLSAGEQRLDRCETTLGIRDLDGPLNLGRPVFEAIPSERQKPHPIAGVPVEERVFRLNGKPVFHNGTGGYENLLGCDHAFTDEQVRAQALMVKEAGFNAFRDAHHPHNLRYYDYWDQWGILCWTQMGSHIYFDNERFRQHYRQLTREWVRERRNHPCIINYGIQNESTLPRDFAREIRDIIIEEDPSVPQERITTTCNGGKGSDWNVPQEWSGTYGGNCNDYDPGTLQMVGEYGAWRRFGTHVDTDYRGDENDRSESWAAYNLGTKIRIAHQMRDRCIGHYQWAISSFANPGRTAENFENRGNGAIGPVNYKGLFTAWHQPSDLFYLYRAAGMRAEDAPMVYIVSHTWPDRWKEPGVKDRLLVYSNCEEVELFNDLGGASLGVRRNPGPGQPFRWDGVPIRANLLHAEGRMGGKTVACDTLVLDHLPEADGLRRWIETQEDTLAPFAKADAAFRINCGSKTDYIDSHDNRWEADVNRTAAAWRCQSWAQAFEPLAEDLASRSRSMAPVANTRDPSLYQSQRYGRDQLRYRFDLPPGPYRLVLHFIEPWYGLGNYNATGWRSFDAAINGETRLRNTDIFALAGSNRAHPACLDVEVAGHGLSLDFPRVAASQAILAGIEVLRGVF